LLLSIYLSSLGAKDIVAIGTGGISGTYFPTGGSICRLVNSYTLKSNIRCVVESTDGSVYNINELSKGNFELGIVQSDILYQAYNGKGEFKDNKHQSLRAIMAIYPELLTLVTKGSANIQRLSDIKGKSISIGSNGSGSEASVKILLKESNINLSDIKELKNIDSNRVRFALQREQIDGYFYMVGHPAIDIKKVSHDTDVSIIPIDGTYVDNLIKKYPYYAKGIIKKGTYKGLQKDIKTYGVKALLVASDSLNNDKVYFILKSILENFDKFKRLHPAYANITKESLLEGLSAPLHDGAKKYYKEIGLLK
jgi:TRAP transporter TAXI family solute receptor